MTNMALHLYLTFQATNKLGPFQWITISWTSPPLTHSYAGERVPEPELPTITKSLVYILKLHGDGEGRLFQFSEILGQQGSHKCPPETPLPERLSQHSCTINTLSLLHTFSHTHILIYIHKHHQKARSSFEQKLIKLIILYTFIDPASNLARFRRWISERQAPF